MATKTKVPGTDMVIKDIPERAPAILPDKPLPAAQLKNLEKIVDNDFQDLHDQVNAELNTRLSLRLDAIAKEFNDEAKLKKARAKLETAHNKMRDLWEKAMADVIDTGVSGVPGTPLVAVNLNALSVVGRGQAENMARNAHMRLMESSRTLVNRLWRAAQREVLMQGISQTNASDLINDLPEPADILEQVAEKMQAEREDDLRELGFIE